MEEWMVKMMELAEMIKLTFLFRENTASMFIANWKPIMDFFA